MLIGYFDWCNEKETQHCKETHVQSPNRHTWKAMQRAVDLKRRTDNFY